MACKGLKLAIMLLCIGVFAVSAFGQITFADGMQKTSYGYVSEEGAPPPPADGGQYVPPPTGQNPPPTDGQNPPPGGQPQGRCGDGSCNNGETQQSCSQDCGQPQQQLCGNGNCDSGESQTCPRDCGAATGPTCNRNGQCESQIGENQQSCPDDCKPPASGFCGDKVCGSNENQQLCPEDCGGMFCNYNGRCDAGEGQECSDCKKPASCNNNARCEPELGENQDVCVDCKPAVSGTCNRNKVCEQNMGENQQSCPDDCGAGTGQTCNHNGQCERPQENEQNCQDDCKAVSGPCNFNNMCEPYRGETSQLCPQECGAQQPVQCNRNGNCERPNENEGNCPEDCKPPISTVKCNYNGKCEPDMGEGPGCPDCGGMTGCMDNGKCDQGEPSFCKDCFTSNCGNGRCDPGEDMYNCAKDCFTGEKPCNNNKFCDSNEGPWCADCQKMKFCGDGMCDGTEDPFNCPMDCGAKGWCGDSKCDSSAGENDRSCPQDCRQSTRCGDRICGQGENSQNCPMDCMSSVCNNGICESGEKEACPQDCKVEKYCGDSVCEDYEKEFCFADCKPASTCGNKICEYGEYQSCYQDCKQEEYCGDGICSEPKEDYKGCPMDCRPKYFCGNGVCEEAAGEKEFCAQDCGGNEVCGNGFCGFNENPGNCAKDCTFHQYFMDTQLERFFYKPGEAVQIFVKINDETAKPVEGATVRARVDWMGKMKATETRVVKIERTQVAQKEKVSESNPQPSPSPTSTTDRVSESNPQPSPSPTSTATTTELVSESNPQPSPSPASTAAASSALTTATGQAVAVAGRDGMIVQEPRMGGAGGGIGMPGQVGPNMMGPQMGPGMQGPMMGGAGGGIGMPGQMGQGMPGQIGPNMMGPQMGQQGMMNPQMGPGMQGQMESRTIKMDDGRVIKVQMQGACPNGMCCPDMVCDAGEMMNGGCPDDCKGVPGWNPSRGFSAAGAGQMGPPSGGTFRGFEDYGSGPTGATTQGSMMGGAGGIGMGAQTGQQATVRDMVTYEKRPLMEKEDTGWKKDIAQKFPIELQWNAEKQAYAGSFQLKNEAEGGQYDVAILGVVGDRRMEHRMTFTVGAEGGEAKDVFSLESKAKALAMQGDYANCADAYLKASNLWVEQQNAQRVIIDVEKAAMCVVLGDLDRDKYYGEMSKVVESASKKRGGPEKYIMIGTAAQYMELAGRQKEAKDLYRRAIKGLEREAEFVGEDDPQGGIMLNMVLAKYYELVGQKEDAVRVYSDLAENIRDAFSADSNGPPEVIQAIISAKLYEVAGKFDDARAAYEEATELIEFEEGIPGDAFGAVTAFMKGYCFEKAGDNKKAMEAYKSASELLPDLEMTNSEGIFFGSSAVGKAYERLGDKEKAQSVYMSALKNLEVRTDNEGYYFASGLAGYTGDFEKAKILCKQELLRNLDANDIPRMTFYSAYCYDVLGAGRKAKAACNLAQTMPEAGETIMMRYVFEPFPTPVSFCSKQIVVDTGTPLATCGNGQLDSGETEDTCCSDVGCGKGSVCSAALNKCVLPAGEIEPTKVLKLLLELEDIRAQFDSLASKALGISNFFKEKGNAERAGIWAKVSDNFVSAGGRIDDIQRKIKANKDNLTEAVLEDVRKDIKDLQDIIKNAINIILEAV